MKFKLSEIRALEGSLIKLTKKELPIKVAYRISKISKKILEELTYIENCRFRLVEKYSNGKNETGNLEVLKEKEEDFKKEFSELLSEETEFECKPILISELGDIFLTSVDLILLDKLICEDEEKIDKKKASKEKVGKEKIKD